jgi:DNA-binding transcriptional LysR family regulator
MLDVRRMKVLREVARHGSFSAAADSLGYTQPAVSRQIATLEAETGTVLVRRQPHGVHLTDAGRVLVEHTDAILSRLDDAEAELRAVAGLQSGRLRISAFASVAATIVPLAVAEFRDRHPGIELGVEMAEGEEGLPRMKAGELDLVLTNDPELEPDDGSERVLLFEDPMYVAMPTGHPLAKRASLRLRDLAQEPWMLGTTRTCPDSRLFRRACMQAGFEPRIAFQNDDYNAILGFVAAGVGVALIPDVAARTMRDDVALRSLGPNGPARTIVAAVPGGYRPAATDAMLDVLREVCDRWVQDGRVLAA